MLYVLKISDKQDSADSRFAKILAAALQDKTYKLITNLPDFTAWCSKPAAQKYGSKLFFALQLPPAGISTNYVLWLNTIIAIPNCLEGCIGSVLIDGGSEFFTKKLGRELIWAANAAGCCFPGKPLVEATGSLANFNILAQIQGLDNFAAYQKSVLQLIEKLQRFQLPIRPTHNKQHLLVLHASSHQTSNTLLLWKLIRKALEEKAEVEEISLRNGELVDCNGCAYETCLHFGEKGSCFYGGVMVDKVYPAIKRCDNIILLCPNYNDAVSANLTAFINRLTALFRQDFASFATKKVFALVVSGYSGGDIVAEQVIGALNCNKNFILPAHFALIETANAPQSVLRCQDIEARANAMAQRLLH